MNLQYVLLVESTGLSKFSNKGKEEVDVKHDVWCQSLQNHEELYCCWPFTRRTLEEAQASRGNDEASLDMLIRRCLQAHQG